MNVIVTAEKVESLYTKKEQKGLWTTEILSLASKYIDMYTSTKNYELKSINSNPEDFKQEIFEKWCKPNVKTIQHYNPQQKGFKNYIYLICYRHLGDMIRRKHNKSAIPLNELTSIHEELTTDGFTLEDVLEGEITNNNIVLKNIIATVPQEILPIKNNNAVTYRNLFILYLTNTKEEISTQLNLDIKLVKKFLKEIQEYLYFQYNCYPVERKVNQEIKV